MHNSIECARIHYLKWKNILHWATSPTVRQIAKRHIAMMEKSYPELKESE